MLNNVVNFYKDVNVYNTIWYFVYFHEPNSDVDNIFEFQTKNVDNSDIFNLI